MRWNRTFAKLLHLHPTLANPPSDYGTIFWEDLYQAFKARMLEEMAQEQAAARDAG
jgi:hypothetical protein